MNPLDQQLQAVMAIIRSAGGQVHLESDAPDYVKKAFLEMLLDCSDCRKVLLGAHDGTSN
jgi:hypothetical protein